MPILRIRNDHYCNMKLYELNCLLKSSLALEEIELIQRNIVSLIEKEGGFLIDEKKPFKKKIANLVSGGIENKERIAYLINLIFNLEPVKLEKLREGLSKENQIIRHLILIKKTPRILEKRSKLPKDFIQKDLETIKQDKTTLDQIEEKLEEILGK